MTYPIIEIEPDWVLEQEQLGTKDKYWVKKEGHKDLGDNRWLFKYPKKRGGNLGEVIEFNKIYDLEEITGMHWSEKIAYELTKELRILSPKVELATLNGNIGSLTENFASEGYALYHGNQLLAYTTPDYDPTKIQKQNDHKMSNIIWAIGDVFTDIEMGERAKQKFVNYLVFDALICNVDRHHENWGILRKRKEGGGYKGRIAPSYDHASSLGRELIEKHSDNPNKKSMYSLLKDPQGVERYVMSGHGPIYIEGTGRRGPSPLKLVQRCLEFSELTPYFQQGLQSLSRLNEGKFNKIIQMVPDEYMSKLSKDFAYRLLCVTLQKLHELHDGNK